MPRANERFVLTVDLKDDPSLIAAYEAHHRRVWPEVLRSLRRVGVLGMDIYRLGRRLVMVMDARKGFDLRRSFAAHVASDPRCAEWETWMKTFQEPPPGARRGELWTRMRRVFHLGGPQRSASRRRTRVSRGSRKRER
jgi:L-rhamnose mutarotase